MLEIIWCERRSQRDAYVHYVEVRTSIYEENSLHYQYYVKDNAVCDGVKHIHAAVHPV